MSIKKSITKKTLLVITDGIGHNTSSAFNAFTQAKTPTYDYLFKNVPNSLLHTYGEHVGLPKNQMGNSEVGHMSIGSGRVLYQDLVKINISVKDNTLEKNTVLQKLLQASNDIHLIGLASDGGVHSHINHIVALAKIASKQNKKVFLHIISDGRDVSPDSAITYIKQILEICDDNIQIASLSGRYYSMDRDNRWERIQKAYETMSLALNKSSKSILDYIEDSYKNKVFDEFILPASFNTYSGFKTNDGIICCNFRSDRMREMTNVLANKNFEHFPVLGLDLNIITMTQYDKKLPLEIMFPKDVVENTLAEVISKAGLSQVHTAETEKYAHVTFFFNGGIEEEFLNETRVLIPSPKIATYDLKPQMSAPEVGLAVKKAMEEQNDFIVVNFANGDMVGHTGNFEAAIRAVEAVDSELDIIIKKAKEENYNLIITSDHGNCEMMRDKQGNVLTNHTVGDVYCFIMASQVKKVKNGSLGNIAPTILKLMQLDIPDAMNEVLI